VHAEIGEPAHGVVVDSANGKVYWTEGWPEDRIWRANLDGSDAEILVVPGANPFGIDLDPNGGKFYWTQEQPDIVRRADLDGSNVETLIYGELSVAHGIALDLNADKVYWYFENDEVEEIRRADLDGSNSETAFSADSMGEMAIDPVPEGPDVPAASPLGLATLALLIMGASAFFARNRGRTR